MFLTLDKELCAFSFYQGLRESLESAQSSTESLLKEDQLAKNGQSEAPKSRSKPPTNSVPAAEGRAMLARCRETLKEDVFSFRWRLPGHLS